MSAASSSPEVLARVAAAKRAVLAQTELLHREFGRAESKWKYDGSRVTAVDVLWETPRGAAGFSIRDDARA